MREVPETSDDSIFASSGSFCFTTYRRTSVGLYDGIVFVDDTFRGVCVELN